MYHFWNQIKAFGILIIFCILFVRTADAQTNRTKVWTDKEENANFIQGQYAQSVSAVAYEVISFHTEIEPYTKDSNQSLKIAFYAPETAPFFLRAEEKKNFCYYRLESQPANVSQGITTFDWGWKVDSYLMSNCEVASSNLGVLLRLNPDKGDYLLPVSIYHSNRPNSFSKYRLTLRVKKKIQRGAYKVYKGVIEPGMLLPETALFQQMIGKNPLGKALQLSVPIDKLGNEEGWFTLLVETRASGSSHINKQHLFFYHRPQ